MKLVLGLTVLGVLVFQYILTTAGDIAPVMLSTVGAL